MTSAFSVCVTPHFERLAKALNKQHTDFVDHYERAIRILSADPYNRARTYQIRKLQNVAPGLGAWRLRLGRWRFRYDVADQQVELVYCGLRREETYR